MKSKPIKIIDKSFNFLGEIDDYESLIFTRSWGGIGGFEIHINANKNYTGMLRKENIIFINEKKAGVILYREISTEDNERLIVKGQQLKTYLGRRITLPPTGRAQDYKNDYVENIMKHYVEANCVNPAFVAGFFFLYVPSLSFSKISMLTSCVISAILPPSLYFPVPLITS
jgi:hypothetical protein